MIQVQDFNLEVLKTHKAFFLLDDLPKNSKELEIFIQTPTGLELVDFIDVFAMQDGSLLAGWGHPYQKLGLQSLIAKADNISQIINLYLFERICTVYDKPIDSSFGVFTFAKSQPVPNADWRCDRGYYGPARFQEDFSNPIITSIDDIIVYESFLSVPGAGHLIYIETGGKEQLGIEKINNSVIPTTGRTFQELLRLIYEWSVLAEEPFNSTDEVTIAAKQYLNSLNLTEQELNVIRSLTPMQVSQFISGSLQARVRPTNVSSMNSDIANILFKRIAFSSLSFIVARNANLWDFEEVYNAELQELEEGMARFREYYGVPEYEPLDNESRASEFAKVFVANQDSYIDVQLRGVKNKDTVTKLALSIHDETP